MSTMGQGATTSSALGGDPGQRGAAAYKSRSSKSSGDRTQPAESPTPSPQRPTAVKPAYARESAARTEPAPSALTLTSSTCMCGHHMAGHADLTGWCLLYRPDDMVRQVHPWHQPIRKCECRAFTQEGDA